jgi:hypothetical protein
LNRKLIFLASEKTSRTTRKRCSSATVCYLYQICCYITYNFPVENDFWPNPSTILTNATFAAEALAEYNANKSGPATLPLSPAVTFLPLNTTHRSPATFLAKLAAQPADAYLAPNRPAPVIAGYAAQKKVLTNLYSRTDAAVFEAPFGGACSRTAILQKPLSRGNIHINASDPYGAPIIDFRVFSNPLDVEYAIESIVFNRKYVNTPTLAFLQPVETGPGPNVTDTDTTALEAWVHATSGPTSFHASGTAAMLPRDLGGVVDSGLRVHGTKGLSVVDASIMPLIPSAHLSATVYAVAEKVCAFLQSEYLRCLLLTDHIGVRYHQSESLSEEETVSGLGSKGPRVVL